MLKKLDRRILFIIGACLTSAALALIFELLVNRIFPQPHFFFSFHRFIAITISTSGTICLIRYREYFSKNLHKAFLLISLVLGVSFVLVLPRIVYLSPDDQIHFRNAYFFMNDTVELKGGFAAIESSGIATMKDRGFDEMASVYETIDDSNKLVIDGQYHTNDSPQLYTRIVYLPFYVGFQLANFLHLNFTTGVVIAKLFNLFCYITLVYFAIRNSGKFNKIFFVVGLLTCNIFLATQFSYDPLVFASMLLAISMFLHMRQEEKVTNRYLLGFILASTFGCLTKAVYCPILLLALMIPNSKFDCKGRAITFKACAMLVMLTLASTFILPILSGGLASDIRGGDTSVGGQISFLLSSPFKALAVLIAYIAGTLPNLVLGPTSFVGLGAGATAGLIYERCLPVTQLVEVASLVMLIWAAFNTCINRALLTTRFKIGIAVVYFILVGGIAASMYLSFTSVGSIYIDGLQPRYFMPFLPLLLILFIPAGRDEKDSRSSSNIILFAPYLCLALILATYILRTSML